MRYFAKKGRGIGWVKTTDGWLRLGSSGAWVEDPWDGGKNQNWMVTVKDKRGRVVYWAFYNHKINAYSDARAQRNAHHDARVTKL